MTKSIWTDSPKLPEFPKLQGSVKTDTLIIGGGLCGILCTYLLQKSGVDSLLVEAGTIGSGATHNTTAKITSQHGLIYHKLLTSLGRELTSLYLTSNEKALAKYRELSQTIDCDFEEQNSYIYSLSDRRKIEQEVRAVTSLGFPAFLSEESPLPFSIAGAAGFPGQAQFHPLKFLAEIASDLPVYEHTFIKNIAPHKAWSDEGEITAKNIIVTTHFPFLNKYGNYFLKLYQQRSYVLALKNAADIGGMYMDENENGLSFRGYHDMLLLGGGGHRTGKSGGGWQELRDFAAAHYPSSQEKYAWAAQDCMSLDGIPYIGRYSRHTPDLYVASGFNKWGITTSMVAAMLLCDLITEQKSPWEKLYTPSRSIWKPQLFLNGLESVTNLLTPTLKRCPHLGCALKWNPREHTWDCPCHGSRFEEDGTLIDNPATGDARV